MTAGQNGSIPIYEAARHLELLSGDALVARVHAEFAGGSVVNRQNLITFFGGDPVRTSGGLVASYTVTDPDSGAVLVAGVVSCRTVFASLREIQSSSWTDGFEPDCSGRDQEKEEG
jgi:hypothetical protein